MGDRFVNGLYDNEGRPFAVVLPMDVECLHCGAPVGKQCRTPLGMQAKFHRVRLQSKSAAQTTADSFYARGRS